MYRLAYTIRFVRSVILSTAFLYGFIGITRFLAGDGTNLMDYSLRICVVIFILCIYTITYTDMFKQYYEYWLSFYVISNSITLLLMAVASIGIDGVISSPVSLMPPITAMLVLNYILPMKFKTSVTSGFFVSLPYMCVSICYGSINHIITTLMIILAINVLMALNSYSNEQMVSELWIKRISED